MAKYVEVADALRARIQSGEFPVGSKLPSINALQEEYGISGLNTIRAAQQRLVEEGMIATRQGVGAFVVSTESLRQVDVVATLKEASAAVTKAIAALEAPRHVVSFDLNADDDIYFVLTTALEEFAARTRHDATDEALDASSNQRWTRVAETALEAIEAAL